MEAVQLAKEMTSEVRPTPLERIVEGPQPQVREQKAALASMEFEDVRDAETGLSDFHLDLFTASPKVRKTRLEVRKSKQREIARGSQKNHPRGCRKQD